MILRYLCLFTDIEFQNLRKGNKESIQKLYQHYSEIIFNFLYIHLEGNRTVADDILQETFEIVLKSHSKIRSQKNLKSWLLNIAYRRLLLYFRQCDYDNRKIHLLKNEIQITDNEPHELLIEKQKYFLISIALKKIRPIYRRVFEMKYMKELSQKEIAKALDKTEGAVEQLLIRAKKAIKKEISIAHDNFLKKGGIV